MKRSATILLLAVLCCFGAQAQNDYQAPQIKISTTKVRFNGRQFYAHVVRAKETLYSICRAYGVTADDVINSNKALSLKEKPLRTGDVLLIPVTEEPAKAEPVQEEFLMETPAADTVKTEPASKTEPADTVQPEPSAPEADTLKAAVPEATDAEETVEVEPAAPAEPAKQEPADTVPAETVLPDTTNDTVEFYVPETVNVTLILPFNSVNKPNSKYLAFYMGALLASRELGTAGTDMVLNVVDTWSDDFKSGSVDLSQSDVIIGPISTKDIQKALAICPRDRYIVSPLDTRTEDLVAEGRVILAATPTRYQIEDCCRWMNEVRPATDTLIVISEPGLVASGTAEQMLTLLPDSTVAPRLDVSYDILESLEMQDWFKCHSGADRLTHYMIASERDVFVGDAVRNIDLEAYLKHQVVLYGPSKLDKVSETEDLCDANLHMSTTYYIDYKDPATAEFILAYRALYNTDPDSYAFDGYDTMLYFAGLCAQYGRNWPKKLAGSDARGLQTDFHFENRDTRGYVNEAVRRVIYKPGFVTELQ